MIISTFHANLSEFYWNYEKNLIMENQLSGKQMIILMSLSVGDGSVAFLTRLSVRPSQIPR